MLGLDGKIIEESDLEDECEVTQISLKKAMYFKQEGYKPFKIYISGSDTMDVKVDMWFYDDKTDQDGFFSFTGFSIGYGGTGPRGLEEFLKMFNIELPDFNPLSCNIKDGPYSFSKYPTGWILK